MGIRPRTRRNNPQKKAKIKATGEIITLINRTRANEQGVLGVFYWIDEQGTKYPASDLDFLPEKETAVMNGFVARDRNSQLMLFLGNKPIRETDYWDSWDDSYQAMPSDLFPSVTWQSEPKKVRIIIEEI